MPRQRACRLHAAEVGRGLGGDSWDKDPWNSDNVGRLGSDKPPQSSGGFRCVARTEGDDHVQETRESTRARGSKWHVLPEIEDEFRELVRRGIPRVRAESGNGSVTNLIRWRRAFPVLRCERSRRSFSSY